MLVKKYDPGLIIGTKEYLAPLRVIMTFKIVLNLLSTEQFIHVNEFYAIFLLVWHRADRI